MRDLETCKAEVFRRSEEKIRERTRMRRRALTLCVPLVLCLVAGAVVWPNLMRDSREGNQMNADSVPLPEGYEVVGEMDPEGSAVLRIDNDAAAELLASLATDEDAMYGSTFDGAASRKNGGQPSAIAGVGNVEEEVTFILVTPEGDETYTLSDGLLICQDGDWQRRLTEEEEATLRQTLGLPADDSR